MLKRRLSEQWTNAVYFKMIQNFWFLLIGFDLMFLFLSLHFPGFYLRIGMEYDQYQYHRHKFYRTASVMQKVCFHVTCSEMFRFPSVDAVQINRNRNKNRNRNRICGSRCTIYLTWRKGKSTLPRECNFAGQSHAALDRFWSLVGEVSALGSGAVRIQTLSAEVSCLKTEIEQKLNLDLNLNHLVLEQPSMVRVEIAAMSRTVTSSESCSYFVQSF
jgi:hypothetical protein